MERHEIKTLAIELMDAANAHGLTAFSLKTDDFHIKFEAMPTGAPVVRVVTPVSEAMPAAAPEVLPGTRVEAPLVGIYYAAPAPDAPPFIEVGQPVSKGATLCIIEAMKTMNEITAPCDGTVSRILVQPGDMVEYKQPIIVIE